MHPHEQLEKEFGEWIGSEHCVACATGTAALHLALESMRFAQGSQVLVPEYTMVACARAVTMAGLTPIFVDCGDDLLMDPYLLQTAVTYKCRAVMPVHVYGRQCDMESIVKFARRHNLVVIEDCAEYHGGPPTPDYRADVSCWSFYRNKIVAGEEGGMISYNMPGMNPAHRARELRCQGFTRKHDFFHTPRGVNARLSDSHATLILKSLRNVQKHLTQRRQVEQWYNELVPQEWQMPPRAVPWVYDMRIPNIVMDTVVGKLVEQGIALRHGFKPMSMQPEYRGHYRHLQAFRASREIVYLPIEPTLTRGDVVRMVAALQGAVETSRVPVGDQPVTACK